MVAMSNHTLTPPVQEREPSRSMRDRIQIALAIADETALKSLLVDCMPAIASPQLLGNIHSSVGVPIGLKNKAIDGILQFEELHCVLADSPAHIDPKLAERSTWDHTHREFSSLTRCESEMHILGQTITLAQALLLLNQAGFSHPQVESILHLPSEAWHKSWWYTRDAEGAFTVPFLRLMRTLRYSDGTLTLQYKDYYSQVKPSCFHSHERKVVIEIKPELHNFRKTLAKINHARQVSGIDKALLICDAIPELEAKGFISQGISLYTANELILPVPANCAVCATQDCPLRGVADSPVMTCCRFCLDGEGA